MLAMTQQAADAVERLVEQPGVPESAVLRIAAAEGRANGSGATREVQFELVAAPTARDLVVQEMRIAVEPSSLPFLDDKVLDARLEDEHGEVEFLLFQQPDDLAG
jgi:Fe-S cluster assembly iron-binding protein IscA